MKICLFIGLALLAFVSGEAPEAEYLPPAQDVAPVSQEYLAPDVGGTAVSDDGYRYKTVRRFRHRNRRETAPGAEYLPPNQEAHIEVAAPSNEYLAPEGGAETVVGNDGYRYKTVRRFRNRNRRDVSELPGAEYLPPNQEAHIEAAAPSNEYIAPEAETVVANDGYRYKTVRRFRNRNRRDVSELPGAEYLPPNQEAHIEIEAPSNQYIAPEEHATVVGNDGYRYKAVKKFKVRRH